MKLVRHLVAAGLLAIGFSVPAHAVAVYGLSQGQSTALVTFDSATPGTVANNVPITGFTGTLLGIDVRPATGQLYGLSSTSMLYVINPATGVATPVATLSTPLSGTASIDFNPTVDRLRIVSSTGQNLRVNVDTGAATVDTPIAFGASDPNAGKTPNVVGIAYTNSVPGATTTTLFDFELGNNVLTTQAPPNNGQLNTIGGLGALGLSGFDIFAFNNQAFASGTAGFYSINLATGAATLIGAFASGLRVGDIAVLQVPEPATGVLVGLGLLGLALHTRRQRRPLTTCRLA